MEQARRPRCPDPHCLLLPPSEAGLAIVFEYTELSDAPSFNSIAEPFTFCIVLLNIELLED